MDHGKGFGPRQSREVTDIEFVHVAFPGELIASATEDLSQMEFPRSMVLPLGSSSLFKCLLSPFNS